MATYLGHQEDSSGNILLPTPHSMATQIEFGTTASQAYAKGAYVVFNNRLCKASTAIASGNTLAIGTNLVQCSNGNEFYFDYKDGMPGFYPSASKVASEFVPFGGSTDCVCSKIKIHGQFMYAQVTYAYDCYIYVFYEPNNKILDIPIFRENPDWHWSCISTYSSDGLVLQATIQGAMETYKSTANIEITFNPNNNTFALTKTGASGKAPWIAANETITVTSYAG